MSTSQAGAAWLGAGPPHIAAKLGLKLLSPAPQLPRQARRNLDRRVRRHSQRKAQTSLARVPTEMQELLGA